MTDLLGNSTALIAPLLAHAADFEAGKLPLGDGHYGWITLLVPLAGALIIALGYRKLSDRAAGWIGTTAIFVAFGAAIAALLQLQGMPAEERHILSGYKYASSFGVDFRFDIYVDPLSVFMCLVVTGVSALIHLYSVAYMKSDEGYRRFFAYLNFFVFSMLLLVLAGNLALLVVGWAFVGAASYLLISFWYRRRTATAAGIKAFVINVIGDVGIVVAAFLLWNELNTLSIPNLLAYADDPFAVTPSATFTAAALLLLVGAIAKSAQIPLHTWLPDAMEGPTPVSALIHAATMVTAGVYLIARFHPYFEISETAAITAGVIGAVTMIVAATTALVQTDLKRIIAYSTMSQIGYMFIGVSAAAYSSGLFHLMTHAFFKALLFMAAGSVIAAMGGIQDVTKMGGFRKAMPFTYATFLIGALTLAGFPLLSGFFSKDEIIGFTMNRGGTWSVIAVAAYFGALLTAFYSLRAVFLVFHGKPCEPAAELEQGHLYHGEHVNPATGESEDTDVGYPGAEHHIAEREPEMKIAMGTLALLSVVAGALQIPGVSHVVGHFLEPTFEDSRFHDVHPSTSAEWVGLAIGGAIALAGIAVAYWAYVARPGVTTRLAERARRLNAFLRNAWYFDAIFDFTIVRPTRAIARFFDNTLERVVAGGIVNGTSGFVRAGAQTVRAMQTGLVRVYALSVILGVTAIAFYFYVVAR
ncbi:MAG TPA: NADH-quinone oxidoreductase subunit L [Solirubrobacterales bacterium]|nr:NADH-quinone oxidoreductase subunit L [Solirubrobacterales bacterium]